MECGGWDCHTSGKCRGKQRAPKRSGVHYSKFKLNPFFKTEKKCTIVISQGDQILSAVATKMLQNLDQYKYCISTGLKLLGRILDPPLLNDFIHDAEVL